MRLWNKLTIRRLPDVSDWPVRRLAWVRLKGKSRRRKLRSSEDVPQRHYFKTSLRRFHDVLATFHLSNSVSVAAVFYILAHWDGVRFFPSNTLALKQRQPSTFINVLLTLIFGWNQSFLNVCSCFNFGKTTFNTLTAERRIFRRRIFYIFK